MDLKDVCLVVRWRHPDESSGTCQASELLSLDPVEFLYECLTSEAARRQTRKVATRIKKSACFDPDARIENTLYAPDRNRNRGLIERLASCD